MIAETLKIRVSVLMGANIANEIAQEYFSEATIASANDDDALVMKKLFDASYFRITTVPDVGCVELCGALKNVVAIAAGISDGLGYCPRTTATVIRLGFMEITQFVQLFYPETQFRTFYQSSGVADLIATCYGGRNHRLAEQFAKEPEKSFEMLEKELLNGQHLQGPDTAAELNVILRRRGFENEFPVFTAVHRIATKQDKPSKLLDYIRKHPEYSMKNVTNKKFTVIY